MLACVPAITLSLAPSPRLARARACAPCRQTGTLSVPAASASGAISCLHVGGPNVVFIGFESGAVHAVCLKTGKVLQSYEAPADAVVTDMSQPAASRSSGSSSSAKSTDSFVSSIAVYGTEVVTLAVGHRDGTIHNYEVRSGRWVMAFKTAPKLTQLLGLRKFNTLAALHEGMNVMQLWDMEADRFLVLDFNAEQESMKKQLSKFSHAVVDNLRDGTFPSHRRAAAR